MTEIEASRHQINQRAQSPGHKNLSTTVFLIAASAWALRRNPWINATLKDNEIHLLSEIHIGVAVAREDGLIVPVLRDADKKTLYEIAGELDEIAERAKQGALKPEQISGGTFTVSNLGMFGIDQFNAIINPPESAILAVGRIRREVVPDEDDSLTVRSMMRMTLSCDHRVIDGAIGAQFMADLSAALETPALLLT
jgi:pyruvate dehydrogenase E2 component (dihydrolipoamide acetyltransferase)